MPSPDEVADGRRGDAVEAIVSELERMEKLASKAPWGADGEDCRRTARVEVCYYEDETPGVCGNHSKDWPMLDCDAELIAAARNALPRLLKLARLAVEAQEKLAWINEDPETHGWANSDIDAWMERFDAALSTEVPK